MKRPNYSWVLSAVLLIFLFTLSVNISFASDSEEFITTIILINQQAELVDVTEDGAVLKRHMRIPDYFSSNRSHESTLMHNMKKIDGLSSVDNFEIPGDSHLPSECLQAMLATDRMETYSMLDHNNFIDNSQNLLVNSQFHFNEIIHDGNEGKQPDVVFPKRHASMHYRRFTSGPQIRQRSKNTLRSDRGGLYPQMHNASKT